MSRRLLAVIALVVLFGGGFARASDRGEIVFASDRGKDNPGELFVVSGGRAPVDISRSAAADVGGTVSPTGDRVAFWSDRSGAHEKLYLVDPDGTHLVRVAGVAGPGSHRLNVSPIAFSSGGAELYTSYVQDTSYPARTIAFRVDVRHASAVRLPWCRGIPLPTPDGALVACPTSGLDADFMPLPETTVWRVRGTGRPTRVATIVGSPSGWTPDAKAVEVTSRSGQRLAVPIAGGPARTLKRTPSVTVSSTGRRAYLRGRSLVLTGPGGHNPRVVARFGPFSSESLSWFPDGDRLLVSTVVDECGAKSLFTVSPDGSVVRAVSHDPRDLEQPSWSRSGTRIAYAVQPATCDGKGQSIAIETIGATGTGRVRVTDAGTGSESFDSDPAFSPDGTQIAFVHSTSGDTSALEVVPAGGGTRTTIRGAGEAVWSPDGRRILGGRGSLLVTVPLLGSGGTTTLSRMPAASDVTCGYGGGPAWSADGTELAVARAGGIWTRSLRGSQPWRLAINMHCAGEPAFSPDGRQIVFDAPPAGRQPTETDIYVANVDGTHVRVVSATAYRQSVHPSWSAAG